MPGAHDSAGNQLRGQFLEAGRSDSGARNGSGVAAPDRPMRASSPSQTSRCCSQADRVVLRERRQSGDKPRLKVGVVRGKEEVLRVPPLTSW